MNKQILILLCVLAAAPAKSKQITPRDLVDEAKKQLENLKSLVMADIAVARAYISTMGTNFNVYTGDVFDKSKINIEQKHQTMIGQITLLKDLAAQANKDVSSCTEIPEQLLDTLVDDYISQVRQCITSAVTGPQSDIINDALYLVDVVYHKVNDLEFQLNVCKEQILCVTQIVSQIEQSMVTIPQTIQKEVSTAEDLLAALRIELDTCVDSQVVAYTAHAVGVLRDIESCINRILG